MYNGQPKFIVSNQKEQSISIQKVNINFSFFFYQEHHTSECQTVWIQIRTDSLSGLIWVQTVCIGFQQTTVVPASKEIVKPGLRPDFFLSVDLQTFYCNFPESRKKNLISKTILLFHPPSLNIICFVEKIIIYF